jgi:putative ABC transport system permease protein
VWFNAVSAGYFKALGTVVLEGRDFTDADRAGSPRVAIVNQAFARKYINGPRALGKVFTREGPPANEKTPFEIVGVVEDAVYRSPRDGKPPTIYLALPQSSAASGEPVGPSVNIVVRAAGTGSPMLLSKSLADALARMEPSLSLTFRPLAEQFDALFVRERLVAVLSAFFGGLALLMAAIGLYGVTAYAVSCRRTEIGVRMALGADAARVVRLVLGRVAWLVGAGVAVGLVISLWASRFVSSLLYGLDARDTTTLTSAAAVLATVAALAAWLPARRAARIDPAEVLRNG